MSDSQKTQIKALLERGESITPMGALSRFQCFRLAAVIFNLRDDGMDIETIPTTRNGKKFATYKKAVKS